MTYVLSAGLQTAVYECLTGDAALAGMIGDSVFDTAPKGSLPPLYVTLGTEDVIERGDQTGRAARHQFTLSVVSEETGFHAAKQVAALIEEALSRTELALSRGRVVNLIFYKARARRVGNAARRRIDMQFRAILDDA